MNKPNFLSLRSSLYFFTLGVLVAIFIFGLVTTSQYFNLTQRSKQESLDLITRSAAENISHSFGESYNDLKALANNLNLTNLSQQELQNKLNQTIAWHEHWDLLLVVDHQGNYISSSTNDKKGKSVDLNTLRNQHFAEATWFRSVVNNQMSEDRSKNLMGVFVEDFLTDTMLSTAFHETRFATSFSAPIKNSTNQTIAVVTARVNTQWIQKSLKNYYETIEAHYNNLEFSILNSYGKSILEYFPNSNSGTEQIFKDYSNYSIKLDKSENLKEELTQFYQLTSHSHGKIIAPDSKVIQNFALSPLDGKKILSLFNWKLLVKQNTIEFFSSKNSIGFFALIFFIVLMIGTFLSSIFIIRSVNEQLETLAHDLTYASNEITTSSFSINDASTRHHQDYSSQLTSITAVSGSISSVSSTVKENIEMAEKATHLSDEINQLTTETQTAMNELKDAMQSINGSNQRIESLVKIIEEIGEKTEIIDDIVFKTQLLSFNASVEAERAGEHGRGFSVVAQEVGNLAQLSGKAATEIATIVKNSIREANIVSKENKDRVEAGEQLTKVTSTKLESVTQKLTHIFEITGKISEASKDQGNGLNQAIHELREITNQLQQNNSTSSQHAKNIEDLENQSKKVLFIIDRIKNVTKTAA